VALGILALLAAYIVPRVLNSQQEAEDAAATAIADNLNHTYADWVAAGGQVGSHNWTTGVNTSPQTSDLLYVLSSDGSVSQSSRPAAYDGGTSSNVRTTLPSDTMQQLASLPAGVPLFPLTMSGTYLVAFVTDGSAPGSGTFYVAPLNSTNGFVAPHDLSNLTQKGFFQNMNYLAPNPYDFLNIGQVQMGDMIFMCTEPNLTAWHRLGAFQDLQEGQ
jgi:type II secretory pathway pseudopilin PulG